MVVTLQSYGGESDLDPVGFSDTPARFSDNESHPVDFSDTPARFSDNESDLVDFSDTPARFSDGDGDIGGGFSSACSTPFVSAPSSPSRGGCYFFSAPASPVHFVLYSAPAVTRATESEFPKAELEFEFDFSSRLSSSSGGLGGLLSGGSMISADELFSNGQIKPMKLSSHLQKPQILTPLIDLEIEEEDDGDLHDSNRRGRDLKLRSRSVHRKARSLSPLRNAPFLQPEEDDTVTEVQETTTTKLDEEENAAPSSETTPSSSRSSSSGSRNSMKWIFLNNLLHRSKSEGGGRTTNGKEKFWSNISFSSSSKIKSKDEKSLPPMKSQSQSPVTAGAKPTNGISKRRRGGIKPSPHELHYTTNRAQAEEMKKRTYLPYRHGLFGCLGFSSKGYSALNGLARSLNTVSSR